jgi:hypothetical protein
MACGPATLTPAAVETATLYELTELGRSLDEPLAALGTFVRLLSRGRSPPLHSKKETLVADDTDDDVIENEANDFAADFLVPPEHQARLHRLTTDSEVEAFAGDIGIAPGIVVGRLQQDEKWGWNEGYGLKPSPRIVDAED